MLLVVTKPNCRFPFCFPVEKQLILFLTTNDHEPKSTQSDSRIRFVPTLPPQPSRNNNNDNNVNNNNNRPTPLPRNRNNSDSNSKSNSNSNSDGGGGKNWQKK